MTFRPAAVRHVRRGLVAVLLVGAMIAAGCSSDADTVSTSAATIGSAADAEAGATIEDAVSLTDTPMPAGTTVVTSTTAPVSTTTTTIATTTTVDPALDCSALVAGRTTIDIAGTARSLDLYLPADLGGSGTPAPLMVLFHGFAGSAEAIARSTSLASTAPAAGVVLAVPQGVDSPATWHYAGDATDTFGDTAFVDAVLADLTSTPCVDPQRVWLAGFSAGSAFTGVYGCSHADRIAGLMMVSGLAPPICPVDDSPIIQITHGIADPLVRFAGGVQGTGDEAIQLDSVPVSSAGWAAAAGCATGPTVTTYGTAVTNSVTSWGGCVRGPSVSLTAISALGHAWPGDADPPPGQGVDAPVVDPGCVALRTMTDEPGDPWAACFVQATATFPSVDGAVEVATTELSLIDTSRPTAATASTPEIPSRTLATTVVFPLRSAPSPLIVLSHGLTGTREGLSQLAGAWARAGFVVALPAFPLTNGRVTNAVANLADVANQPADVSFVIDQLLALDSDPSSPIVGRIDSERIGVAGHSLGGATTYAVAFNDCCRDPRIDAVVILAGFVMVEPQRNDFGLDLPVMILHGDADPVLDIALDLDVAEQLSGPTWFVTLLGGTHSPPFENDPSAADEVVERSTTQFWLGQLGDDRAALDAIAVDAVVAGVSTLQLTGIAGTGG